MAGFEPQDFHDALAWYGQTRRYLGWLMKSNGGDFFHCFFHSEDTLCWKGKTAFSPFGFGREKRIFAFIFHEYAENKPRFLHSFPVYRAMAAVMILFGLIYFRQLQCFKHVSHTQKRTGNQFPIFSSCEESTLYFTAKLSSNPSRLAVTVAFPGFFAMRNRARGSWPSDTTSTTWTLPGSIGRLFQATGRKR